MDAKHVQARSHKSRGRIDRFKDIEERAKQNLLTDNIKLGVKSSYLGSKIFEAKNICKGYENLTILDNFNYTLPATKKWVLSGKTEQEKPLF